MKFKIGDRVRVKSDLSIGNRYYMEDGIEGNTFSEGMRNNLGKEATIIAECEFGYTLDIDRFRKYTDGMIERYYNDTKEVEDLINHIRQLIPEQQINNALDTDNKEAFKILSEKYRTEKGR